MSEEVVADFTGKLLTEDIDQLKPVKGRILLNREQLVLVTGEGKESIFLSKIVSTNPGSVADSVSLSASAIELSVDDKTARINVEAVIGFEHEQRELMDRARPTLILDHAAGSTTLTTYISLLSKRKLTFLSQFVRLNYSKVVEDVRQTEVSATETQALISLYSAGGNASLDGIVTDSDADAEAVAEQLLEKQLVTQEDGVLYLTSRGEIVVTEQLESVNE